MARYDTKRAWYRTPNGRSVLIYVRESTNDHNTAYSSLNEDEYGLRGLELSGIAIDIGGYLGTVAIGLLLDHPDLVVHCVEPIPENVDLIRKNADINGVTGRLILWACAVGDGQPTTIHYGFTGDETALHHAFVGNGVGTGGPESDHKTVTAQTLTLGSFPAASLLKLDCEGGEWDFLASGDPSKFPLIIGEWHPVGGHTRSDLVALLPAHVIEFSGPEEGPGEFRAVLRPYAGEILALPSYFARE